MKQIYVALLFLAPFSIAYAGCESINTSRSSWIEGSQYCNGTLTIDMGNRIYKYDDVSEDDWNSYKNSSSLGSSYNSIIKKNYDYSDKYTGSIFLNDLD